MDLETAQTTTTAKLPILKQENGNSFEPAAQTTINVDGTSTSLIPGPVTTEEKVQKKNDVKARKNGVTRTKKYVELSAAEKFQADCDMKATNIILQGLPADIYSLVNHHKVAKDLWERVQLLM
ncbi:hypothetical protein Tco_1100709 [Tanacetum coccineum]